MALAMGPRPTGCDAAAAEYSRYEDAVIAAGKLSREDELRKVEWMNELKKYTKNTSKHKEKREYYQSAIDSLKPETPMSLARWCCTKKLKPLARGKHDFADWDLKKNKMLSTSQTNGVQYWKASIEYNNKRFQVWSHIHFKFAAVDDAEAVYDTDAADKLEIKDGTSVVCAKWTEGTFAHDITGLDAVDQGNKNQVYARTEYEDVYKAMSFGGGFDQDKGYSSSVNGGYTYMPPPPNVDMWSACLFGIMIVALLCCAVGAMCWFICFMIGYRAHGEERKAYQQCADVRIDQMTE